MLTELPGSAAGPAVPVRQLGNEHLHPARLATVVLVFDLISSLGTGFPFTTRGDVPMMVPGTDVRGKESTNEAGGVTFRSLWLNASDI